MLSQHGLNVDHQRSDWLLRLLALLRRDGGLAFRAGRGQLVLVTPSSKLPGCWQATWFAAGGPYRDRLATSPRQLLWQIRPAISCLLSRQQADLWLRRLLT